MHSLSAGRRMRLVLFGNRGGRRRLADPLPSAWRALIGLPADTGAGSPRAVVVLGASLPLRPNNSFKPTPLRSSLLRSLPRYDRRRKACAAARLNSGVRPHLMTDEHQALLTRSVPQHHISLDGRLTNPRTWGAYDLGSSSGGRRFRYGNHPIRMTELLREHGKCSLVALFYTQQDANRLAVLLNTTPPRSSRA